MELLVTGGAGFIGSNFIRYMLKAHPSYAITNLDKLTYAGNLDNLKDIEAHPHYRFVQGDISDPDIVDPLAQKTSTIINFAAETHVDRSILDPGRFIQTDVHGTFVLIEAARKYRHDRYIQISTDEVYGSIDQGSFNEESPLRPTSPYSASKAAADLLVMSYVKTYGLPAVITRSSNNFGPYQYPEKVIPLFITNAINDATLPLYGDGENIRDWIYVLDHCRAIDLVLHKAPPGSTYNIGGGRELSNLKLTKAILTLLKKPEGLIQFVEDRPGHDRRYSLETNKLSKLGFECQYTFEKALQETVTWYQNNHSWWDKIKSGEFQQYYRKQYREP